MKIGNIWIDTLEVAGIMPALTGMRNPMDSWSRSDSYVDTNGTVYIGVTDLDLAKRLRKAGKEHRKYLRQIQVWADINLPRYVLQELDTYRFGTKNSCSTMHTLMKYEIGLENFYLGENPSPELIEYFKVVINELNRYRNLYILTKDYNYVIVMKRILPESFIQMRTWNTNYEELLNLYHQRKNHRLKEEYKVIIEWIESLPNFKELCLED